MSKRPRRNHTPAFKALALSRPCSFCQSSRGFGPAQLLVFLMPASALVLLSLRSLRAYHFSV